MSSKLRVPASSGEPKFDVPEIGRDRRPFLYSWPNDKALGPPHWKPTEQGQWLTRLMPESTEELAADSRWPAMFPSAQCIATTTDGKDAAIEKVVGATIVNRFPYVLALPLCREALSDRHYERRGFMEVLERSGSVTVQFLRPGPELQRALVAISEVGDDRMSERLERGMGRPCTNHDRAPVLDSSYLVYEARFVRPGRDFDGVPINAVPWTDFGSHRIYYLEITHITLADSVASGAEPLQWRSLPTWRGAAASEATSHPASDGGERRRKMLAKVGYTKSYQPDYVFPSPSTVAFAGIPDGRGNSALELPPLPEDQVEVDNDRARWPCFFPSSLGIVSAEGPDGIRTAFPCGSTSILSRSPLTVTICVSYARINDRYAPRASLDVIRRSGRFRCGVPVYRPDVLDAIAYLGNISLRDDPDKVANCGLTVVDLGATFGFAELPIQFDCVVEKQVLLGTHVAIFGRVERIFVDRRLADSSRLEWCPWAGFAPPRHVDTGASR